MQKFLAFLGENRGSVGNIIFVALASALQPWLVTSANQAIVSSEKNFLFAFLMFALVLADLIGIYYKIPAIAARNKDQLILKDAAGIFTIVWIGRLILSTFFFVFGFQALGFSPDQEDWVQTLFGVGMMAIVIKELVILGYASYKFSPDTPAPTPKQELLADLCSWFYISFSFTVIWDGITSTTPRMSFSDPSTTIVNLFAISIMFCLFFFPLRAVYLVEDHLEIKTKTQTIFWWVSILGVYLTTLVNLFI